MELDNKLKEEEEEKEEEKFIWFSPTIVRNHKSSPILAFPYGHYDHNAPNVPRKNKAWLHHQLLHIPILQKKIVLR
jgi:hypothetical protein